MFPFIANVSPAKEQEPAASELKEFTERLSARARTEGAALFASMRNVSLSTFLDEKTCAQWEALHAPKTEDDLERERDEDRSELPTGADGESLHVGLPLHADPSPLIISFCSSRSFGAVARCAESDAVHRLRNGYIDRKYEDSPYQWLPAEFAVGKDGAVTIQTRYRTTRLRIHPRSSASRPQHTVDQH